MPCFGCNGIFPPLADEQSQQNKILRSTILCGGKKNCFPTIFTCVAAPTTKAFRLPNLCSNRQLEPPLPLNFSCKIFRHSALAPNFTIDPIFRTGDVGSLVHPRECGEATAVSVTFHPDLVAEIGNCGSRRLNLRFLVL